MLMATVAWLLHGAVCDWADLGQRKCLCWTRHRMGAQGLFLGHSNVMGKKCSRSLACVLNVVWTMTRRTLLGGIQCLATHQNPQLLALF